MPRVRPDSVLDEVVRQQPATVTTPFPDGKHSKPNHNAIWHLAIDQRIALGQQDAGYVEVSVWARVAEPCLDCPVRDQGQVRRVGDLGIAAGSVERETVRDSLGSCQRRCW